jgi:hypothetical protein
MGGLLLTTVLAAQTPAASPDSKELNLKAYVDLLRTDIQKDKVQVMSTVMQLDADESAKFWPIYKEFQSELSKIGDQVLGLIKTYTSNYDAMKPAIADQLATKLLDLERQRNDLKKKYYQRFKTATDAITAMRFLQVENQLERLIDLQVASELPVIQSPGAQQ